MEDLVDVYTVKSGESSKILYVQFAIQRAKTYTDAKNVEFSEAIIAALEEMAAAKVSRVNGATTEKSNLVAAIKEVLKLELCVPCPYRRGLGMSHRLRP